MDLYGTDSQYPFTEEGIEQAPDKLGTFILEGILQNEFEILYIGFAPAGLLPRLKNYHARIAGQYPNTVIYFRYEILPPGSPPDEYARLLEQYRNDHGKFPPWHFLF